MGLAYRDRPLLSSCFGDLTLASRLWARRLGVRRLGFLLGFGFGEDLAGLAGWTFGVVGSVGWNFGAVVLVAGSFAAASPGLPSPSRGWTVAARLWSSFL